MPHGLAQPYGLRGGLYKVFYESKNCNACGLKFSLRQKKSLKKTSTSSNQPLFYPNEKSLQRYDKCRTCLKKNFFKRNCKKCVDWKYSRKFCVTKLDCKPKAYLKSCKRSAALTSRGNFSREHFSTQTKKVCKNDKCRKNFDKYFYIYN